MSAESRPPKEPALDPTSETVADAPATHEDAVDLIERELGAGVIAAEGYDERLRALPPDARKRKSRGVE